MQFLMPWWKIFAEKLNSLRLKSEIQFENCFFSQEDDSHENNPVVTSSAVLTDRSIKICVNSLKTMAEIGLKHLETKSILTAVVEKFYQNPKNLRIKK